MCKKPLLAALFVIFSIFIGACGRNNTEKSSGNAVETSNSVDKNENSVEADKKSGGQITVIAGADKGAIKMRSTRFR